MKSFDAAHQLCDPRLSADENRALYGKCVNLHGHRYQLEVIVAGDMDDASGYVVDLKQLADVIKAEVIQHVDHHNLNTDVTWLEGRIPTAENLAIGVLRATRAAHHARHAPQRAAVGDGEELG